MQTIWLAFITGLTTGGISCIAVQGGLLASSVTQKKSRNSSVFVFLLTKVLAYTFLGFLLGAFGSLFALSVQVQGWMQIILGCYVLATVGRVLHLHPIFAYTEIRPPQQLYRYLRIHHDSPLAPALLGLLTLFMPCGVTQTMMVAAIATGKPLIGAAMLGAFTLGTSPVFFLLGATLIQFFKSRFFSYIAAAAIAYVGIVSINGGIVLTGSPYTIQNMWHVLKNGNDFAYKGKLAELSSDGKQNLTVQVSNEGYALSANTLKVGIPVHLSMITDHVSGCVRAFTIPSINMTKILPETGVETVEFTPKETGKLAYSCNLGLHPGAFDIIP